MPGPLLVPAIAAAAQIGGQALNAGITAGQNRKQRKWSEKMYKWERQDALADWTMQNEYNSPVSQMARLREGGLNPNLVYGNGATTEAGTVKPASAPNWNPRPPELDLGGAFASGLGAYYDTQLKQAQIDNLKVQNTVATQDAILRAAQVIATTASTEKTKSDTATSQFDLGLKNQLKEISVQAAQESVRKQQAEIKSTLDANERAAAMQQPTLLKAAEEVLNMRSQRAANDSQRAYIRQQIEVLRKDEKLKQLDIDLKRMGIQPSDALWQRALGRLIEQTDLPNVREWYNRTQRMQEKKVWMPFQEFRK